jgi:hypothetical protein
MTMGRGRFSKKVGTLEKTWARVATAKAAVVAEVAPAVARESIATTEGAPVTTRAG